MATKSELRKEIAALRHAGGMMANICFNIGQRYDSRLSPDSPHAIIQSDLGTMRELRVKWDAIPRAERKD